MSYLIRFLAYLTKPTPRKRTVSLTTKIATQNVNITKIKIHKKIFVARRWVNYFVFSPMEGNSFDTNKNLLTSPSTPPTSTAVFNRCDNDSNSFSNFLFNSSKRWVYTSVAPGSASGNRISRRGGEKLGRVSTNQST